MRSFLKIGCIAALAMGVASAKEIEIDEVTITGPASREGRAAYVPWSGIWWPFTELKLATGWNGTAPDFEYDETAKQWKRKNESKPVNDRSPLLKYDEYVRLTTGTDPQAALLECTGDEANEFEHSVYGEKKKKYDEDGISYGWWGHCNGWCGAALMEKEPIAPIEVRGIRFEVADLKGLLSENYWGVESDFTGRRYNKPRAIYADNRQVAKDLLAALNAGTPKPVADYIKWYETVWQTTMSAAAKAAAKPADFKDELEYFEQWFADTYDAAYKDLEPSVWHRILETVIGRKRLAFVADVTANEEVWNHPAFAYTSTIAHARDFVESGAQRKEWSVTTTVWYATDGVSESILGINDFTKTYTYKLVTDGATGKVLRGEWTGASVDNHPDFAWLPTYNPTGADYGENWNLRFGKVLEILPQAHGTSEARAIDLGANGTRASSRRANDRTTTWSQPVPASGDVALDVAVASGRTITKVKYFEQPTSGTSSPTATRQPLVALGESSTGPAFAATARFASNGKKMVVAYAYSGERLVGYDEITLQYSVSTSGGTTGGGSSADDAFEENDTRAAAAAVAAGSYPNLYCGDDDWFKVGVPASGSLTVRVDFAHSEGDIDMVLQNASGTELGKSDSTANFESIAKTGLAAGDYFVRVYGYSGAKAKYALAVTVAGGGTGGSGGTTTDPNDDSFEPNDDRASAAALAAGTHGNLACNDDDWYRITLAGAGALTFRIDFRHAEGDLDIFLYDASGAELGRSEGTTDSETIAKTGLGAGTYYAKVIGYDGARAAYSATVTIVASSTGGGGGTTTPRTGTVTASTLNVRSGPGTSYSIVTTVSSGTAVTILEERPYWYRITWSGAPSSSSGQLWVYKSYVRLN